MTILPLHKVSLIGALEDKPRVLEAVQTFGGLHLIPLASAQKQLEAVPSGRAREASDALRWLLDCPDQRRAVTDPDGFDMDAVVGQALANRAALNEAQDRRAALTRRLKAVEPWGEFAFTELDDVAGHRLWFYMLPVTMLARMNPRGLPCEIVYRDRYRAYVVLVSPEEPAAADMPVPRIHLGAQSLSQLKRDLEATEVAIEDLELSREGLTKWRLLMAERLAAARDRSARARAALETADDAPIFVLQGWGRADQRAAIEALAARLGVAAVFSDPQDDEMPPTLLENRPPLAPGEDLVRFYQTPAYRDWDPSSIVYVSFVLFFGMIMTDAGYGLLLLGLLQAFKARFTGTAAGRRLFDMARWLMVSTTVFGVLTGSYFGISPPEASLLGRLGMLDLSNVDAMMKITLTIGAAHLILANLLQAAHARRPTERLQPIGWSIVVAGGLATYLGQATALATIGPGVVVAGLVLVGVFASDRPVTSLRSAGLRMFDALAALARVVNIFSDVLSYMRLFALGLAAASLAETVNSLAGQIQHAVPGIGLLIALVVLGIGHAINIGLGLIGGVVHGLRLNVIEFFNWSLKGEGTAFRPFRKEETGL